MVVSDSLPSVEEQAAIKTDATIIKTVIVLLLTNQLFLMAIASE
jgi:hypothetical protein